MKKIRISVSKNGDELLVHIPITKVYEIVRPHLVETEVDGSIYLEKLSYGEREVFNMIRSGMVTKEMARKLNITISAVKQRLHVLYKKLGLRREGIIFAFGRSS